MNIWSFLFSVLVTTSIFRYLKNWINNITEQQQHQPLIPVQQPLIPEQQQKQPLIPEQQQQPLIPEQQQQQQPLIIEHRIPRRSGRLIKPLIRYGFDN